MRRRFNLHLEKDYKLRPTGLEGPNQNKFQEVVFQALETARDRREHLQRSNSKKYGWVVVCRGVVLKMKREENLQATLGSLDFFF